MTLRSRRSGQTEKQTRTNQNGHRYYDIARTRRNIDLRWHPRLEREIPSLLSFTKVADSVHINIPATSPRALSLSPIYTCYMYIHIHYIGRFKTLLSNFQNRPATRIRARTVCMSHLVVAHFRRCVFATRESRAVLLHYARRCGSLPEDSEDLLYVNFILYYI